ncbi:unnamed protein product [Urochloa humidicola]
MPPASVAHAPPPPQQPPCRRSPSCSRHGWRADDVLTEEDRHMMAALWYEQQQAAADERAAAFAAAPESAWALASGGAPDSDPKPAPGSGACGGDNCFSFWMSFGNTALIIFDVFALYVCCFMAH